MCKEETVAPPPTTKRAAMMDSGEPAAAKATTGRPLPIDMALDDIVRANRTGGRPSRPSARRRASPPRRAGRDGGRPSAPVSRRAFARSSLPRAFERASERIIVSVKNDRAASPVRSSPASSGRSDGAKVTVSNLNFKVTKDDLYELFSSVGPISGVKLFYDRAGRSDGVADIFFRNYRDAMLACDRFHHVPLDGHPMQIKVSSLTTAASLPQSVAGRLSHSRDSIMSRSAASSRRADDRRQHRSTATHRTAVARVAKPPRSAPARAGSRGAAARPPADAGKLDADLDSYMMKA